MRKKTSWSQNVVSWEDADPPTLNLSVVFTWHLARAERKAAAWRGAHPGGRVVAGGPAVRLLGAPWADETPETTTRDVLAMHNPDATFTTRGCVRRCKFCAVPRIEGDLRELETWKRAPIVCDNNILAASEEHFARVVLSLRGLAGVDFNQGLDARLLTRWHAEQLASLGRSTVVRFALDHVESREALGRAVELARSVGFGEVSVYVLIGYDDTPDVAVAHLGFARSLGAATFPMRYQPLDALRKDMFVSPTWTEQELKDVQRFFYQRITVHGESSFQDYVAEMSLRRLRRGETSFDRMKRRARRLRRKELQ